MEQAGKRGKITMAHVYEYADAKMIVDKGVNILAHNVRDQEIDADFIATLKRRNVSVISTLAREEGCSCMERRRNGSTILSSTKACPRMGSRFSRPRRGK